MLETLTHAFVTCSVVQPVLAWLLQVAAHLLGAAALPPAAQQPLLVLADLPGLWAPQDHSLWQRLRVAYLGCVWRARCLGIAAFQQRERGLTKEKSARRRNRRECVMEKGKGKTSRPSQATARPGEAHSSLSLRSPRSPTDPAGGPTPVQGVAAPGGAERQNVAWVFS